MRMMTMLLLLLIVLVATPVLCMAALPDVVPGWAEKPPSIDGKLDDACWAGANQAGTFANTSNGREAKWGTRAKIACDEDAFYVSFVCQLPPDTPEPVHRQDGSPVWQDESVELFITPTGSPNDSNLHQFVVNVAGAKSFLRIHEVQRQGDWQAAVSRQGSEWTAEMRIPYSIFQNAGANEVSWRIAFCRNAIAPEEYSSWPYVAGRFAYYWNHANLKEPKGHDLFIKTSVVPAPLKSPSAAGGV